MSRLGARAALRGVAALLAVIAITYGASVWFGGGACRNTLQVRAPSPDGSRDAVVFARDWGFTLDEVQVPVRWWHGDRDHIIPFSHGQHVVDRLPDAQLFHLPGESHLVGLGLGEDILQTIIEIWDRETSAAQGG